MYLSGIFIYPIKSCRGISLTSAKISSTGLEHDRKWMLVDENGLFMSQRSTIEMAHIEVSLNDVGLLISYRKSDIQDLQIPFEPLEESIEVQVWQDKFSANCVGKKADEWFSKVLESRCRLVKFGSESQRQVDPEYAPKGLQTAFADGFPFLIIGEASLSHLNTRLKKPVSMVRFRPNLVFTGGDAFTEDSWQHFQVGNTEFERVKACARCAIPTIDPETGIKGKEPMQTLATYRKVGKKVMFGQNLICLQGNEVRVNDEIKLIST